MTVYLSLVGQSVLHSWSGGTETVPIKRIEMNRWKIIGLMICWTGHCKCKSDLRNIFPADKSDRLSLAGNTEEEPGYVTCSQTDPTAGLPNSTHIEVIFSQSDSDIHLIASCPRFRVTWSTPDSAWSPVDIREAFSKINKLGKPLVANRRLF